MFDTFSCVWPRTERVIENLAVYRERFGDSTAAIEPNLHRTATILLP